MTIPDYQSIMLPLLKFASDQKEHSLREAIEHISGIFELSETEKVMLLQSGQHIIDNRVGWARTYLKKAGLLETTKRSYFKITERGLEVLKKNTSEINVKYLEQFPEFIEFKNLKKDEKGILKQDELCNQQTPHDLLEEGYLKIKSNLAQELLNLVKNGSSEFFERLVVKLLLNMGYGGSQKDAGEAIGRSGDEGIDGIIKEDKLGLDAIYIQAKKWEATVGRPEVQKFVGALHGKGAKKGIFMTTSDFSKEAIDYASAMRDPKIVLIDGELLAQLMIDNNIGVSIATIYEIKKIDLDYFTEE